MKSNTSLIWKSWLPVLALSFSAFVFNTTEFAPVALLSDIANSFDLDEAYAGQMITIYAWCVALLSLPLMLLTAKIERKKLLMFLFLAFVFSHVISAYASNFYVLVFSRICVAFSHGIFWSITASLAYRLAPNGKGVRALSFLASGSALAMVLGLPIGRIIGQAFGWRETFLSIGVLALFCMFVLYKLLPILPSVSSGNIKSLPIILKRKVLVIIFLMTAFFVTANFCVYSYIEPFTQKIANFSANFATMILFFYGISGIIGSVIFSKFAQQNPKKVLNTSIILLFICFSLFLLMSKNEFSFVFICLVWGASSICISLSLQTKILEKASDATDVAMSIFSSIFNIGIGGGAFIGGGIKLIFGLEYIGFGAMMIYLFVLFLMYMLHLQYKKI